MWLLVVVGWCLLGSGSATLQFESQAACEAAQGTIAYFANRAKGVAPFQSLVIDSSCQKRP